MARILYDLCLADEDVRPSTYCWTVKFALLFKGLPFETNPVPFADKSKYPGIWRLARPGDQDHLRKSREAIFGKTLEELAATPGVAEKAKAALSVLAAPLANHRYLGGAARNLADYIVMGPFMWLRAVTTADFYRTLEPVVQWRERMLDLFGGYARSAKSAEAA